ncbi:hypothetical protein Bca4012_093358 [Brassica carinata]|uniref:Uncharacterized protein n=1 Tax=Brassica carinata TaxID=52824 RepID=A0A8X7PS91_BRACI|nr:hypothetical protein Bca52824_075567 [Brassica carinata]
MSVRIFEELTQIQLRPGGMRSGLSILTGHPSKTKLWQCYYFYVKANSATFEESPDDRFHILWNCRIGSLADDVPKIVVLSRQHWENFDRRRINDWPSNVPCEETKGKRLKLPLMGKIPKSYHYNDILDAQLEDSDARGSPDGGIDASAGEALVEGAIDQVSDARPSKKKKKKSKSSKRAKAGLEGEREQEVEINQVEDDRLTDEVEGNREAAQTNNFEDLIEDGQVEIFRIEEKNVG